MWRHLSMSVGNYDYATLNCTCSQEINKIFHYTKAYEVINALTYCSEEAAELILFIQTVLCGQTHGNHFQKIRRCITYDRACADTNIHH